MSRRLKARDRKTLQWFKPWAALGYTATKGGSGHWKITDPDGVFVASISATPTNSRSAEYASGRLLRRHEERRQAAREDTP